MLRSPVDRGEWRRKLKRVLIIFNLGWANFAAWACFALLSPFYPHEARQKGVPQYLVGFIFGAYELVVFLTAPFFGLVVHKIGHKFMFMSGVFVCGSSSILFGLLEHCPPGQAYITLCLITRIFQAMGASAYITSCYTLAANESPEKITFVVGILETCGGLGLMMGPVIGGGLFQLGGFGLPFYTMGAVLALTTVISYMILTEQTQNIEEDTMSRRKIYTSIRILIVAFTTSAATFTMSFIDPTLADRLEPFGMTPALVGVMFLIMPAVYAVASPSWGWIADTYGHVYVYLVVGNLGGSVCFLLLGPAPFLRLPFAMWLNIISLGLIGFYSGCALVMAYRGFVDITSKLGFERNLATMGCISGIYHSSMSLGAFLGPTVGGALTTRIGFSWACAVCACIFVPVSLLSLIFFFILPRCRGLNRTDHDCEPKEDIALVAWANGMRDGLKYSQ